jgi:hypothetical protein
MVGMSNPVRATTVPTPITGSDQMIRSKLIRSLMRPGGTNQRTPGPDSAGSRVKGRHQSAALVTDFERSVSRLLPMLRDARVARSSA